MNKIIEFKKNGKICFIVVDKIVTFSCDGSMTEVSFVDGEESIFIDGDYTQEIKDAIEGKDE